MQPPFRHHSGDSVLPNFPLFSRILSHAHQRPGLIAIRSQGVEATYGQLCSDVVRTRRLIKAEQNPQTSTSLPSRQPTFYGLQASGSYEFTIAFLAIIACGGVVVPISPHAAEDEIKHCIETCEIRTLLAINASASFDAVTSISVSDYTKQPEIPFTEISISCVDSLDTRQPGLAVFTSGTTGRPKACLLPREMLCSGSQTISDHYRLSSDDSVLHCLPVHHAAGILISFLPFLLVGATVEFSSGSFNPAFIWSRWRDRALTAFTGVPTMYSRLMSYYESEIRSKSSAAAEQYVHGVRSLRLLISGTSAMPQPLLVKWFNLTAGKRILERYGTTEFSAIFLISPHDDHLVPSGSVGRALAGVDVKLSGTCGNQGEILVKCPNMFLEYHKNSAATRAAHDAQGYYKTGDIARREGPYYFILGRESTDILKSGGYKISALDVEREILGLDYVSEVAVVGVTDEEFGQRVAAALVLKDEPQGLTLSHLRDSLRTKLAGYKMPTLLFVTPTLPKNHMGKIQKKTLTSEVFESGKFEKRIQVWGKVERTEKKGLLQARL